MIAASTERHSSCFASRSRFSARSGTRPTRRWCSTTSAAWYFNQAQYDDARTYFERALALREELKVPSEIAQTVHNLAEVNLRIGQYDKALELYLRALDLDRSAGNKRAPRSARIASARCSNTRDDTARR